MLCTINSAKKSTILNYFATAKVRKPYDDIAKLLFLPKKNYFLMKSMKYINFKK